MPLCAQGRRSARVQDGACPAGLEAGAWAGQDSHMESEDADGHREDAAQVVRRVGAVLLDEGAGDGVVHKVPQRHAQASQLRAGARSAALARGAPARQAG